VYSGLANPTASNFDVGAPDGDSRCPVVNLCPAGSDTCPLAELANPAHTGIIDLATGYRTVEYGLFGFKETVDFAVGPGPAPAPGPAGTHAPGTFGTGTVSYDEMYAVACPDDNWATMTMSCVFWHRMLINSKVTFAIMATACGFMVLAILLYCAAAAQSQDAVGNCSVASKCSCICTTCTLSFNAADWMVLIAAELVVIAILFQWFYFPPTELVREMETQRVFLGPVGNATAGAGGQPLVPVVDITALLGSPPNFVLNLTPTITSSVGVQLAISSGSFAVFVLFVSHIYSSQFGGEDNDYNAA
jgi:hypothetical protein